MRCQSPVRVEAAPAPLIPTTKSPAARAPAGTHTYAEAVYCCPATRPVMTVCTAGNWPPGERRNRTSSTNRMSPAGGVLGTVQASCPNAAPAGAVNVPLKNVHVLAATACELKLVVR